VTEGVMERIVARSQAEKIPLEVQFAVTDRCNLPCTHCYLTDHKDHGELSFDEVCGVMDQLAEAGTVFLTFTGGEVLSRSDFCDILDAASARGFVPKVLSNATLITDEIADRFLRAGVLEVSVSVYSADPEVHDRVTDMPGSFERTMAGIARLRARNIHVVMKAPLLSLNGELARDLHQMATMQDMPCKYDVTVVAKTNGDPGPLQLQLQLKALVELMSSPPFDGILRDKGAESGPEPCNAGRVFCAIGPTGDLMPCVRMPVVMGNLRTHSFRELWLDDPFLARLRAITQNDLHACVSCEVKQGCTRCPGIAMQRGLDLEGCDLSAKQVAKARVAARARLRVLQ
jgi:radical SAM protein with 4Fe4S-binding SPASM domain